METANKESLNSLLLLAAIRGDSREVARLGCAGADSNATGSNGENGLSIAAYRGDALLWRTFRALGCVPRTDNSGNHPEVIRRDKYGVGSGLRWERFIKACETGDISTVRRMGDVYPDLVLGRDGWGRTALHFAAGSGWEIVLKHLLGLGADPHEPDLLGRTPWLELSTARLGAAIREIDQYGRGYLHRIPDLVADSELMAQRERGIALFGYTEEGRG